MAVPALWYAFGPRAGFYLLVARLPGFRSVRAPVHVWFVVALALALLAASGVLWLIRRFPYRWIPIALRPSSRPISGIGTWETTLLPTLAPAFERGYGNAEERFRSVAESTASGPLRRIWAPFDSPSFGPLNGMLDSRIEVTLRLQSVSNWRATRPISMPPENNPRLLDSLAVTAKVNVTNGRL